MFGRLILIVIIFMAGFSTAHAQDNFKIDVTPELQDRLEVIKSRVEHPAGNFGYRTVRLVIKPKKAGDRPVIWAKFYDAEGVLLESIWDRIKNDGEQKCKFDYMDVQVNAVRVELSAGNQQ